MTEIKKYIQLILKQDELTLISCALRSQLCDLKKEYEQNWGEEVWDPDDDDDYTRKQQQDQKDEIKKLEKMLEKCGNKSLDFNKKSKKSKKKKNKN